MHMDLRVIKVVDFKSEVIKEIEHHMPISHFPCCRRSIGPLPSCSLSRQYLSAEQEKRQCQHHKPTLSVRQKGKADFRYIPAMSDNSIDVI